MPRQAMHRTLVGVALVLALSPSLVGGQATAEVNAKSPQRQWPSKSYPEQPVEARICSCLYAGESIPIGQTICMKVRGRKVLATCDTVINTPSWTISTKNCPSS